MLEREFIEKMLEHNSCPVEVSRIFIEFANDNVNMDQFVDFKPVSKETGIHDWLSSIYAACYFARKRGGDEVVQAVYKAACVPHCLYPYEIIGAISYMRQGGAPDRLVEQSLEGTLVYDGQLPGLADVENDLKNSNP